MTGATVGAVLCAALAAAMAWGTPVTSRSRVRQVAQGRRRPALRATGEWVSTSPGMAGVAEAARGSAGSAFPGPADGRRGPGWLLSCSALLGAAGLVALAGPTAAIPAVAVVGLCVVARRHRQLHRPTAGGSVALVADVIAGALGAGMRQPQALAMAARVAAQPLAGQLVEVSRALDAGLPPAEVWRPLAADPVLAGLARACSRGADTGAAIGPELGRLAVRLRREARADGERRAARAAVWLVLPLGACFLPAFVLVTVVPIVIGLVGRLR